MQVTLLNNEVHHKSWNDYVMMHPRGTLYHLPGWKKVIEKTYAHKTYYLMAMKLKTPGGSNIEGAGNINASAGMADGNDKTPNRLNIAGILPLVHLEHFLFGSSLISIPFFDMGGVLADDEETENALLSEAVKLAHDLKAKHIELRHIQPLRCIHIEKDHDPLKPFRCITKSHKARMLLSLPDTSDALMKSFKSKLRSQIKKPLKDGLFSKSGGFELLEDFYSVFSTNMRDLGSPVHSKKIMWNVIREFPEQTRIFMVYQEHRPLACSLVVGFRDTLENPWASSLRRYGRLSPNMLLYWTMLEYACDNGFRYFDFGRSSRDESTYKFKEQWGAMPTDLYWHYIPVNGEQADGTTGSEKMRFERAVSYWQKLPVFVTNLIGPSIRKHIGL